ncbi:UDP-3-O-acyl-N-acetylglucosamine deacetylase [Caulobacter sp. KR2-114]|uniref:UDP-3-O-acyl-N-acetylglucosamine deacetylase n=1 Tax=Caulobacter sp. KR2-114 TaxID=3400912 RepID=UPI003BFB166E
MSPRLAPDRQHTLTAPAQFRGVGIHTGLMVSVEVRPAEADSGIAFLRTDIDDRDALVPARGEAVCRTQLGTVISNAAGVTVSTVEHLMAALSALGIDNAVVALDGPEVPIMDGSSQPFIEALDRAGRRPQAAARRYLEVLEPVEVVEDDKRVTLSPCDRFEMAFEILFDSPAIGRQQVDLALDESVFRRELADCRTFGFFHEVEQLQAAGFARGGSLDNVVVIDGDTVMNPEGLRRPDEFVRHKALDAVGDLYLLGAPLFGRYEGVYAGHGLNNAVVRALLARPQAWRLITLPTELAEAG